MLKSCFRITPSRFKSEVRRALSKMSRSGQKSLNHKILRQMFSRHPIPSKNETWPFIRPECLVAADQFLAKLELSKKIIGNSTDKQFQIKIQPVTLSSDNSHVQICPPDTDRVDSSVQVNGESFREYFMNNFVPVIPSKIKFPESEIHFPEYEGTSPRVSLDQPIMLEYEEPVGENNISEYHNGNMSPPTITSSIRLDGRCDRD
ncbi:uncharacterized protein LOC115228633 [Octopus sinensis]|uniref:Uncharacterized protein LOC115228633 n=1 Tax=Octopus sinensis TaxID=2607531 RepID=A0A6P7TTG8_9MOLL|nr:uncharacterized protein LOC115228633 [Octopus sinensis]